MSVRCVVYYESIHRYGGVPDVLKHLVADIVDWGDLEVVVSDFEALYRVSRTYGAAELMEYAGAAHRCDLAVYVPSVRVWRDICSARRNKSAGAIVVLIPWGLLSRQQSRGNWSGGRLPRLFKRVIGVAMRVAWSVLVDYYWVFSKEEAADSGLPAHKCVEIPLGHPHNDLARSLEGKARESWFTVAAQQAIAFIGRGVWETKGLRYLADLSARPAASRFRWPCYVSMLDDDFRAALREGRGGRLEVVEGVVGAGLTVVLRESAAVATLPKAPAPLRALHEALYGGTPVICGPHAYMGGFAMRLEREGISSAVCILKQEARSEDVFASLPLPPEQRVMLAEAAQRILSPRTVGTWFGKWLRSPRSPCSFYGDV